MEDRKTIAILGAPSRRGRWLVASYQRQYNVVALSADPRINDPDGSVEWRSVTLYSITSTTEALRGVDYALYPMQDVPPSTRLNQGSPRNANLLLADTFARAAEAQSLQHIVFLGEELPQGSKRRQHQDEVADTLASRGVPLTKLYEARVMDFEEKFRRGLSKLASSLGMTRWINYSGYVPEMPADVFGNSRRYHQSLTMGSHRLGAAEKQLLHPLPRVEQRTARKEANTVRSYQRLANPQRQSAPGVAREYFRWLPRFFRYILKARINRKNEVTFLLLGINILQMQLIANRSNHGRQLFYITGGLLVKRTDYGWLEFRHVLDGRYVISALHEFVPRLPWLIYVATQARVHQWVMKRFGKHLAKPPANVKIVASGTYS